MHKRTPEIIELAELLGRTPSSIGMRLGNFASCDPDLQARGVGGLKGGMNQVRPIWDEFYENQEALVFKSEEILAEKQKTTIITKYREILQDVEHLQGKTAMRSVKTRVNQHVFRTMVLNNFSSKCCITGMDMPELLVASHIVPWNANEKERLNPHNGLCLNALMDKAFDKGIITVTPDFTVQLSPKLASKNNKTTAEYFQQFNQSSIQLPEKFRPSPSFLEYHNQHIFQQ
jgi:putative restriction endonuclease